MPLISVRAAAAEARRTWQRFPLVLVAAVVAAVASSVLVARDKPSPVYESWEAVLCAASLGLPLFVVLTLTLERWNAAAARPLAMAAGVLALVGFALAWPHWTNDLQMRRYAQFNIGLHLLVAFLPYLRPGEANGFWQYNRTLFLRFLTSALYSAVLYVGLAIAILAVDQLFKAHVPSKTYLYLWVSVAFVFNTWFFLGGVPEDLAALEQRRDYPRALKVFSQFILIPLVAIYLAILTAYLVRVLATGQWPSGWIGWLVSSVAAVGILSLLLVHPIRDLEENRWVSTYSRWFYVAMLPAIAMLLAAIGKRIGQYGVTEDRYFIAVLALWLAVVALIFIVRRRADIRWIPVTLCLLAFGTSCAPWGAFAVSRRSQQSHLRRLLIRERVLDHGAARPATAPVSFDARKEISSTLKYLYAVHGPKSVAAVIGATQAAPDTGLLERNAYDKSIYYATTTMRRLGMDYVNPWEGVVSSDFWYAANVVGPEITPLAGIDYHVRLGSALPEEFTLDGDRWSLRLNGKTRVLTLGRFERERNARPGDSGIDRSPLVFPVDTLIVLARASRGAPNTAPTPRLVAEDAWARAVLVPYNFNGRVNADTVSIYTFTADLYLTLKQVNPSP